jgi:hypothetical protein
MDDPTTFEVFVELDGVSGDKQVAVTVFGFFHRSS